MPPRKDTINGHLCNETFLTGALRRLDSWFLVLDSHLYDTFQLAPCDVLILDSWFLILIYIPIWFLVYLLLYSLNN